MIYGVDDLNEMFEKLGRHVFVSQINMRAVTFSQFERHAQHGAAIKRHPGRAISLPKAATVGQRLGAIEHADIVQPQEPAGEQVFAVEVLAIDPPGEVQEQFLKDPLEKPKVAVPLVRRSSYRLATRPTRAPAGSHRQRQTRRQESARLDACTIRAERGGAVLGVLRVHMRNRNDMKGQIP